MYSPLLVVLVALVFSLLVSEVFFRLRFPRLVGQIIAGIILGLPFFVFLFTQEAMGFLTALSEVGIIFLLFLTGLEIDLRKLKTYSVPIFLTAIFSAVIPFILGFLLMLFLGYSQTVAIVVGACLALTAEGTKAKILIDFNVLRTKLGGIMLGAGAVDDLFEIAFLALILSLAHTSTQFSLTLFPLLVLAFFAFIFFLVKAMPRIIEYFQKENSDIAVFTISVIFVLSIAVFSQFLGFGAILGALVAGLLLQVSVNKKVEFQLVENFRMVTFGLVVPFFFILIGLNFDFNTVLNYPVLLVLILFAAVSGKMLGSVLVKFFSNLKLRQTILIGWGMNSRGAVELVIAQVAFLNHLIPIEVYSVIVAMAVITTIIFPVALRYYVRKYPNIMN